MAINAHPKTMTSPHPKMLHRLPLLVCLGCAALPFFAVHVAYFLAASYGQVDWCNPYIDSCTSISATGRNPPASFIFRAGMLPSAMLMVIYWWLHWRWLDDLEARKVRLNCMFWLGCLACFGLLLYVTVLGEIGDLWRLQRKIGTVLFFSFTFIAQLLLAAMLREMSETQHPTAPRLGRRMLAVCLLMLAIGIGSVLIQAWSEDWHDQVEDAIEWQLALLLQLNFLLSAGLWHKSPWELAFVKPGA